MDGETEGFVEQAIERWSVPAPLVVGPNAVARLGRAAKELGIVSPLIVTDRGVRQAGLLQPVLGGLGEIGPRSSVFDGVSSNPTEEEVLRAIDVYHEDRADGVIAVGGGSSIDVAKAVRALSIGETVLDDYELGREGVWRRAGAWPPLIAVPTTAGTGSEVSRGAVIVVERGSGRRKMVVAGPPFVSSMAFLDPALTVTMPAWLTAASGMDALTHAVEEVLSPRRHALVTALALDAAGRVAAALPRAFREPADLEARQTMLEAAMMAGVGFEKGLGAVHSLSHAIGAVFPLHHGLLNAAILPAGLELNRGHCLDGAPRELAAAVGCAAQSDEHAMDVLAEWTRALLADLGLPRRLSDLDVLAAARDQVIEGALVDHCHRTNPRPCGRDELVELWERAW